ncbi:MAG: N-acetylmuramoyl-L-alanine amidase [Bacteroidetes bacterium]|nr:N-acetylmuramoyl-L-alanine amidase [Bacteroidota bacterium]
MPNWKPIVGLAFNQDEFESYCHTIQWSAFKPKFIVLHNTGLPTLNMRPEGFTLQHIQNLVHYYRDELKWSAGPHLFIDDHKIWVFTPLNMSGIHANSWNKLSLGVEILGDYDKDIFSQGRGLAVRKNAIAALASLHTVLGIDVSTLKFHKEEPNTTHKNCPGKNVIKQEVIAEVKDLISKRKGA